MQDINIKLLKTINGKKALIWDFDGVIGYINWNYNENLDQLRSKLWTLLEKFEPSVRTKFKGGLKYPYEHTDYIVKKYGQSALNLINSFYLKREMNLLPFSQINKPLIELIKSLNRSIENYIWSNNQNEFIKKMLIKEKVLSRFKYIISRDKVILAKPNLEGFSIIKSLTLIPIKDFLFIGDSNTDKTVSKNIGMDFFLYK